MERLIEAARDRGRRYGLRDATIIVSVASQLLCAGRDHERGSSLPLLASPPALTAPAGGPSRDRRRSGTIEVCLLNGRLLKVDEGIIPEVLARLVAALDGDAA